MKNLCINLWFANLPTTEIVKKTILDIGITPSEFYLFGFKEYVDSGIDMYEAEKFIRSKNLDEYEDILKYLDNNKIDIIFYNDENYPEKLKNIYNPPILLFVKGKLENLEKTIGIVGARKATEYGKSLSYKFAKEVSEHGITVISGMARGIDTFAHRGALSAGCKTIAVLGSGFKNIYPPENLELFNQISNNGCVITEYFPDMRPFPQHFPMRNRIISGLSDTVLIVEAGMRSGSLITASLAGEFGKDVLAVPGDIFRSSSIGTNKLIKDGAKLILNVEDILEEYGMKLIKDDYNLLNLMGDENKIFNIIKLEPLTLEKLHEKTGISPEIILSTLSKLECKGIVKKLHSGYYIVS